MCSSELQYYGMYHHCTSVTSLKERNTRRLSLTSFLINRCRKLQKVHFRWNLDHRVRERAARRTLQHKNTFFFTPFRCEAHVLAVSHFLKYSLRCLFENFSSLIEWSFYPASWDLGLLLSPDWEWWWSSAFIVPRKWLCRIRRYITFRGISLSL